mgnify:CR=1 FL=1
MHEKTRIPIQTIKDWERGVRTTPEWVGDLVIEKLSSLNKISSS